MRNDHLQDEAIWCRFGGRDVQYLVTKIATIIAYTDADCKAWRENTWEPLPSKIESLKDYYSRKGYRLVGLKISRSVHNNGGGSKQFAYHYSIRICPATVQGN